MLTPIHFLTALLSLALAGAVLEGLWSTMPASLVQCNGLVLILSALAVLSALARTTLKPQAKALNHPGKLTDATAPTNAQRSTDS
jgi:hypothetical protein